LKIYTCKELETLRLFTFQSY